MRARTVLFILVLAAVVILIVRFLSVGDGFLGQQPQEIGAAVPQGSFKIIGKGIGAIGEQQGVSLSAESSSTPSEATQQAVGSVHARDQGGDDWTSVSDPATGSNLGEQERLSALEAAAKVAEADPEVQRRMAANQPVATISPTLEEQIRTLPAPVQRIIDIARFMPERPVNTPMPK